MSGALRFWDDDYLKRPLNVAIDVIESRFECVDGPARGICETGAPYVTLHTGGVKKEGQEWPRIARTVEDAVAKWFEAFEEYAAKRTGRLHWRCRPQIEQWDGYVTVRSRLVIS